MLTLHYRGVPNRKSAHAQELLRGIYQSLIVPDLFQSTNVLCIHSRLESVLKVFLVIRKKKSSTVDNIIIAHVYIYIVENILQCLTQ